MPKAMHGQVLVSWGTPRTMCSDSVDAKMGNCFGRDRLGPPVERLEYGYPFFL